MVMKVFSIGCGYVAAVLIRSNRRIAAIAVNVQPWAFSEIPVETGPSKVVQDGTLEERLGSEQDVMWLSKR